MVPVYRSGDILVGVKHAGRTAHNLIGLDCIVETDTGERYVKFLSKSTQKGRFNLRSYNPANRDIEDVRIAWVAPVMFIKRGGR